MEQAFQHQEGTFRGYGAMELYYQSWCPTAAPRGTVAIVHGFGEHSGRYMNVVNGLVPGGYAVYGFDLRGHGRSPGQRGYISDWSEHREDTRAFVNMLRQRATASPLFLMGHSLGGLIALDYALHYPDGLKGVVASSPLLSQPGISPILIALGRVLSRVLPKFSLNTGLDASTLSRNPQVVAAYRHDPLVHSLGTPRLATEVTATVQWSRAHAPEFKLPLLMIVASDDRLTSPQASREFLQQVTFADKKMHEYAGAYHECHNDIIYEQTVGDLKQWLDAHS